MGAERLLCGPQPDGQGGGPRSLTEIMAELKVDSSSLTSQQGLCWTALAVLPLIFLVLLINLYKSLYSQGEKLKIPQVCLETFIIYVVPTKIVPPDSRNLIENYFLIRDLKCYALGLWLYDKIDWK